MQHKVFTYYEELEYKDTSEQMEMIHHWRTSWSKRGWFPVVLRRADAERHPFFKEFANAVLRLPTINAVDYEMACYHRWLAVAAAGGGYMSDYDVINYSYEARNAPSDLTVHELNLVHQSATPSVVSGTQFGFMSMCLLFATCNVDEVCSQIGDTKTTSDMFVVQKTHNRMPHNVSSDVVQYGDSGWDSAELVHYCSDKTSNTNRVECIKTARTL
jgi:hypothetical protein